MGDPQHSFFVKDAGEGLRSIKKSKAVSLIITSPPYYGCRDYTLDKNELGVSHIGISSEIGHEKTPFDYVRRLAAIFGPSMSAKYLKNDGSLIIVIGDTFARKEFVDPTNSYAPISIKSAIGIHHLFVNEMRLLGWRFWQEEIWVKPSAPPSGAAKNRCNPCHEYILWFDRNLEDKPRFEPHAIREEGKTPADQTRFHVAGTAKKSMID